MPPSRFGYVKDNIAFQWEQNRNMLCEPQYVKGPVARYAINISDLDNDS
jgi:hypothetical protein